MIHAAELEAESATRGHIGERSGLRDGNGATFRVAQHIPREFDRLSRITARLIGLDLNIRCRVLQLPTLTKRHRPVRRDEYTTVGG